MMIYLSTETKIDETKYIGPDHLGMTECFSRDDENAADRLQAKDLQKPV